jgi:hypothetical protein
MKVGRIGKMSKCEISPLLVIVIEILILPHSRPSKLEHLECTQHVKLQQSF